MWGNKDKLTIMGGTCNIIRCNPNILGLWVKFGVKHDVQGKVLTLSNLRCNQWQEYEMKSQIPTLTKKNNYLIKRKEKKKKNSSLFELNF